jgi:hypothetical protein
MAGRRSPKMSTSSSFPPRRDRCAAFRARWTRPRGSPRRPRSFRRPRAIVPERRHVGRIRRARVDGQRHEAFLHPALFLRHQRGLAGEVLRLVEPDEPVEPAFEQAVIGRQVPLPRAVALFDAQRVQRPHAEGFRTGAEHRVVECGDIRGWRRGPPTPVPPRRTRGENAGPPRDGAGLVAEPGKRCRSASAPMAVEKVARLRSGDDQRGEIARAVGQRQAREACRAAIRSHAIAPSRR